jgi:ABC-type nitrate/sulfonate/bicarbonate transport system substrate-binding protein
MALGGQVGIWCENPRNAEELAVARKTAAFPAQGENMAKKKIRIYYRAPAHVPLWKVMEECGFLAKHGFEMEFGSMEDKRARATEGLLSGHLDIVSGNHHSLYARRALHNEPFVHIGQVQNDWQQHWLVAGNGIKSVAGLKGKRLSIDKLDQHPGLNAWLFLGRTDWKTARMSR